MTLYQVEYLRQMPGREEPAVIDVQTLAAADLDEAIHRAGLSLFSNTFRVRPEAFQIREVDGPIVF